MKTLKEKKISIFCPMCDRKLFSMRATDDMEVTCPKCGVKLAIELNDEGLHVRENIAEYNAV